MTKARVQARIENVEHGTGLWLIVEHGKDHIENTLMAISENEVLPIKEAIEEYLEKESQEIMKESMEE